ncbi:hypothetical protein CRM22_005510 [Opisthorchis felineus]|uniref:MD-2-related lipid-recognition domain-containing protein n=1 Tax=Opisthorchis felineus TaxID=147828 RepID=A0A4S2LXM3_OPIFE|nr:hypothetical protein CRM22_005510 [Opisthorchis felineus]
MLILFYLFYVELVTAIQIRDCGSVKTDAVESVTIDGCAQEPCVLQAGGPIKVKITFTSPLDMTKPKSRFLYYSAAKSTSPEREDNWGIACNSEEEKCFKLDSTYNFKVESSLPNEKYGGMAWQLLNQNKIVLCVRWAIQIK